MRRKDREELEIRMKNQRWEVEGEGEEGREWREGERRGKGRKKMRKREN